MEEIIFVAADNRAGISLAAVSSPLAILLILLLIAPICSAGEVLRLTRDHADEILPRWDPAGETISFATNREPGRVRAIGAVQADGSGERLLATGSQDGFGIVSDARATWLGETGWIVTAEASNFHELLQFELGADLLERSVLDGDDEVFKVLLKVDGGGGSQFHDVSRDGGTVVWRYSTVGADGEVSLRFAPHEALKGGAASSLGRPFATREQTPGVFHFGDGALSPEGDYFVLSDGNGAGADLFLFDLERSDEAPVQLTDSGKKEGTKNCRPRISPDGAWVAYDSTSLYGSTDAGKIVMAKADLHLLRIADRQVFALTETKNLSESGADWAPDGRRLVFERADTREAGTVDPGEPDNKNLYLLEISEQIFRTPHVDTDK